MSNHHTNVGACPLCADKLAQAHPTLAAWFLDQVKPKFPDAHIAWSFRNEEDQNQFLRDGKTRCAWPNSKHNVMEGGDPKSHALDLFQINGSGVAVFVPKFYFDLNEMNAEAKNPIEWAGKWVGFKEMDHFQLA